VKDVRYTSGNRADLERRIALSDDYEHISFKPGRVTFTGSSVVEHFECSEADSTRAELGHVHGITPEQLSECGTAFKHPRFWESLS